jgi:hypothetical protein
VRREHRKTVIENYVDLCQAGIEQVQVCMKRTLCRSSRRRVSEKDTHRVIEYSVGNPCKFALSEHKECVIEPERVQGSGGISLQGVH